MALRLPRTRQMGVQALGRRSVQGELAVARSFGAAFEKIGAAAEDYLDKQADMEETDAGLSAQEAMISWESEHAGRDDYAPGEVGADIKTNLDRPRIPGYEIKAEMYRAHGLQALEKAAKMITDPRRRAVWAGKMKLRLGAEYVARKEAGLKEQKKYQIEKSVALANKAADDGNFVLAVEITEQSRQSEGAKIVAREVFSKGAEIKGVDDAISSGHLPAMEAALGALADTKKSPYKGQLNSGERRTAVVALRARIDKVKDKDKAVRIAGQSQSQADKLWRERGDKSLTQLLDEARKISSVETRAKTLQLLRNRSSDQEVERGVTERQARERALGLIHEDPTSDAWLLDSDLTETDRRGYLAYQKKLNLHVPIQTNPTVYNQVFELMGSQDEEKRKAFAALDLTSPEYLNGLSNTDRTQFVNEQKAIRAAAAKTTTVPATKYPNVKEQVDLWFKSWGGKTASPSEADATRLAMMRTAAARAVEAATERKGANLTPAEARQVIDAEFAATFKRQPWYGALFTVAPDEVNLRKLDPKVLKEAVTHLRSLGEIATPRAIQAYLEWQAKQK